MKIKKLEKPKKLGKIQQETTLISQILQCPKSQTACPHCSKRKNKEMHLVPTDTHIPPWQALSGPHGSDGTVCLSFLRDRSRQIGRGLAEYPQPRLNSCTICLNSPKHDPSPLDHCLLHASFIKKHFYTSGKCNNFSAILSKLPRCAVSAWLS